MPDQPNLDLILFPQDNELGAFSEVELARTERVLGVRLPKEYVALLRKQNGGRLRLKGIFSEEPPNKWCTDRPVFEFESIAGIHPDASGSLTSNEALATEEWGIPKGLVPIDGDGHWWLCLDYRECGPTGEPVITHYDTEFVDGPQEFRVASSFGALLRGLIRSDEDCYFALTDPTLHGRALDDSLRRAGCRPYRHEGMWEWTKCSINQLMITVTSNAYTAPDSVEFPELPRETLLVRVSAAPEDQAACIRAIAAELGNRARLIHQAPDRDPVNLDNS